MNSRTLLNLYFLTNCLKTNLWLSKNCAVHVFDCPLQQKAWHYTASVPLRSVLVAVFSFQYRVCWNSILLLSKDSSSYLLYFLEPLVLIIERKRLLLLGLWKQDGSFYWSMSFQSFYHLVLFLFYFWVEMILLMFCFRYGPVHSVKQLGGGASISSSTADGSNDTSASGSNNSCWTVAFMDICSATKAYKADHRIEDRQLKTSYYNPSVTSLSSSSSSGGGGSGGSSHYPSQQGGGNGGNPQGSASGANSGGSANVSHYPPSQGHPQGSLGSRSPRFQTG